MLYDLHTHSIYSDDADNSMTEMALAAAEAGLGGICFTDHADLDDINGTYNPLAWRREEYFSAFEAARKAAGDRIALRLGLELGEASHYPDIAREVAAQVPDFIIGSVHNLAGTPDFYCGRADGEDSRMYASPEACHALLERYVSELEDTAALGCFDVIGHIGYPLRYMRTVYPDMSLEPWRERLAELFRALARMGKGIELNCSGLRQSLGETMPSAGILALYRDMGGEIVTLGSDAHRVSDVGKGLSQGKNLLIGLGFSRYCVYNKRKAEFINL
ncbi:MAG: histidinol-phosphatase HisJ family protein [Clostridiales bacterium]|nr:histidinol-phosphatase HisJ family protein [Clostridiales bacterium]